MPRKKPNPKPATLVVFPTEELAREAVRTGLAPRQIHLSITVEQRAAAERIAGRRTPTTWQQIAREALTAGLAAMEDPPQRPEKEAKP